MGLTDTQQGNDKWLKAIQWGKLIHTIELGKVLKGRGVRFSEGGGWVQC